MNDVRHQGILGFDHQRCAVTAEADSPRSTAESPWKRRRNTGQRVESAPKLKQKKKNTDTGNEEHTGGSAERIRALQHFFFPTYGRMTESVNNSYDTLLVVDVFPMFSMSSLCPGRYSSRPNEEFRRNSHPADVNLTVDPPG